jgi:hypothetical protein
LVHHIKRRQQNRAFGNTVARRISETKTKKAREGRRTKLHKIALE